MDTYCNPHWPTSDNVIPFRLFDLFNAELENHLIPLEELTQAQAVSSGRAFFEAGKEAKVRNLKRRMARKAYPEETIRWQADEA